MNTAHETSPARPMPTKALILLVFGMMAAWLAAGSLGWIAPPLQKVLIWLALAGIVLAALPGARRFSRIDLGLLVGATLIALLMTASALPVVNILAVAVLLAAIALVGAGLTARVSGLTALAITAFAVYRLVVDSSAAAWTLTTAVGRAEGAWGGWLAGRPLSIAASFGGVDFLVLMAALTTAWLLATPRPCLKRAAWAVLFICLAQTAYLVVLALSNDLSAMLPPRMFAVQNDITHLGLWTWGNALRSLLPWALPVLAAIFQCAVVVAMFRLTSWPAADHEYMVPGDPQAAADVAPPSGDGKRRNRSLQGGPPALSRPTWRWFAPSLLLIAAAVALNFSIASPNLKDRAIVAYDDGATDWSTSDNGAVPRYGLLPALVESLGGKFIRSGDLSEADLREASVLIVLPPRTTDSSAAEDVSIPAEIRERIWKFVSAGGRMIVAGEPEMSRGVGENVLNSLLEPTAISFRDDTADSLTQHWEDNLQVAPHPATASSNPGQSTFSFDRPASLRVRFPAGPLVSGRWAWNEVGTDPDRAGALAYTPGNRLGDLVLAAQQNVGWGTVVVLDAAACMSNNGIPFSYPFTVPLLSALAANSSTPLAWWRQLLGAAAAAAAIVLLYRQFASRLPGPRFPLELAAAAATLALAAIACHWLSDVAADLQPSGSTARPIIYVDGSHLEAFGKDPGGENGIGRFMQVLASNDFLPLMAPDLSPKRLERAAMLISIAPARAFTSGEIAAIEEFVNNGGFFLSMVGAPDAGPSRALLSELQLQVAATPAPPWVGERETEPIGRYYYPPGGIEKAQVHFYEAWPVSSLAGGETWPKDDPNAKIVIAGSRTGKGQAFIIGDSAFVLRKNFDWLWKNAEFWRTMLNNWMRRPAEKTPAVTPDDGGLDLPEPKSDQGGSP